MQPIRRRLEESAFVASLLAAIVGAYLSLCNRTIRWQTTGRDDLIETLQNGPVLLVTWHERSLMGPLHWPVEVAPLSSLHDASPIGRVSGVLQKRVGLRPIKMNRTASNIAASRAVLRQVKDGVSIGMTGDGPVGPVRVLQNAPLEWARVTGMPVFVYGFAASKALRLNTWDRMVIPRPFGRGAIVFKRWDDALPRDADQGQIETARSGFVRLLNQVVLLADGMVET